MLRLLFQNLEQTLGPALSQVSLFFYFGGLTLLVFVAAGVALGMGLKERAALTTITRAAAVPLFFLSGVFGPISFSTPAVQTLALLFPVHYAIVLEQYAFKSFVTNTIGLLPNTLLLVGYVLVFVALAAIAMRFSKVAH